MWEEHNIRKWMLINEGAINRMVFKYDQGIINKLRNYYIEGIPLSILLLSKKCCNGNCFYMSEFITLSFLEDDFKVVHAEVDTIKLNPEYEADSKTCKDYALHSFVERTLKDGTIWVYDTSLQIIVKKELYYEVEHPVVKRVLSKDEVIDNLKKQGVQTSLKNISYNQELIPSLEIIAKYDETIYKDALANEIEIFKNLIGYTSPLKSTM